VDLIYKLAEECKFDFNFEPVRDNKYGSYDAATDEWDGIIRQLIDNVSIIILQNKFDLLKSQFINNFHYLLVIFKQ